jgi:hypothetical protein
MVVALAAPDYSRTMSATVFDNGVASHKNASLKEKHDKTILEAGQ